MYLGRKRIIGCVDPGSDLTILHESLYEKLVSPHHLLSENKIKQISSFSNNDIPVLGSFECLLRVNPYSTSQGIPTTIYVIPDVPEQVSFLLGADLLRNGKGGVHYEQKEGEDTRQAKVSFNYPDKGYICQVYETSPRSILWP